MGDTMEIESEYTTVDFRSCLECRRSVQVSSEKMKSGGLPCPHCSDIQTRLFIESGSDGWRFGRSVSARKKEVNGHEAYAVRVYHVRDQSEQISDELTYDGACKRLGELGIDPRLHMTMLVPLPNGGRFSSER